MSDLKKLLPHELATLLSVNRRSISRWSKSENLPKKPDGTFDGPACVRWLTERLETRLESECDKEVPGAEWLNEYRRVRFMREELQLKLDKAELLPVAEVEKETGEKISLLISALQNFADRLPGLLVGRPRDEIQMILRDEAELVQHSFYKFGHYTAALADRILTEIGKTNRQKRDEKCWWYERNQAYDAKTAAKNAEEKTGNVEK